MSNKMKLALLIFFLVIAVAIIEVYSEALFQDQGSNSPWGSSKGPTNPRCGVSFGRKKRGINKAYKEQTFYQYDRNSNRCVSFKSSSLSPGNTGFTTQNECEYVCVQRHG